MTEELHDYLERYKIPEAWRAWGLLRAAVPGLAIPNAGAVEYGHVLLTWNSAGEHVELEVLPTGPAEFYYATDWECTWIIGDPLPAQAVAYLRRFAV